MKGFPLATTWLEQVLGRLSGEGLRARALRGTAFTVLLYGTQNILRLGSNLILTRLLFPEAFGLMALMMVVISGVNLFTDIGMQAVVVRSPRGDDPAFLDTAWTVQILRGGLLYVILLSVAPYAAAFYNEPMLVGLIAVGGLQLVSGGLTSVAYLTASRHIRLERVSMLQITAQVISVAVMIALAYWFRSVWALAVGAMLQSTVFAVLSHTALKGPRRRFRIERAAFFEIFHFGKYIFFATIAGFFLIQGDRAVLGKLIPLNELALFAIALVFVQATYDLTNAIGARIVFPLYAQRPPGDSAENWRRIARARWLLSLGSCGILSILALSGNWLIRVLYDPRYEAAGPILVLLAIGTLLKLIVLSYPAMALSAGRSGRFALYLSFAAALYIGVLILGVQQAGIVGAALAPAAASVLAYPALALLTRPFGGLDYRHDAIMLLVAGAVAALALWWNWAALAPLFAAL